MSIRPIVVGSGTGGVMSLGGGYVREPGTKLSSTEALQAIMDAINDDPSIVRNQIQIMNSDQRDSMNNVFWPGLFDPANWTRISTHRPSTDKEGNPLCGTDREVREYENDLWCNDGKLMTAELTTEWGEIIDLQVKAKF